MRDDLPIGTVTFCFTDVEGSTRLLHSLGAEAYAEALAEHRRLIREACAREGGVEVDTQGDAFFFAFPTAPGALAAASAFTAALARTDVRVRCSLHTGTPLLAEEGYVGADVHRAARIAAAASGGQVLVSSSTAALLDRDELRDLGEHRFKDLAAPERVYQLGAADFPPLKTLYRTNLPIPATRFLGRERELAEVVSHLSARSTRLLTLTGPGGTGKTRLALQAAAEAADDYPDGVYWVPLAPLRDPALVLPSVAQALGVREQPGLSAADAIASSLDGDRVLLLLDNCEHVLASAPELASLLARTSALTLLLTSRETVRLQAELEYPVPTLASGEAVSLFCERARSEPSDAIRELCARLDNLPLALELAAARLKLLTPEQLLERLGSRLDLLKGGRDADPRQQTLRATIEWSHDLLSPAEQALFARLSVFAGGCTLEAAEEVCGADPETLESLLDKSLLRRRETEAGPRFWMLETIREFAAERLEQSGEGDELRARHLHWMLERMRAVAPRWAEPAPQERLADVLSEESNIRLAMSRAIDVQDANVALELVGLMGRTWLESGRFLELGERASEALGLDSGEPELEGLALISLGVASEPARAIEAFEIAGERFRAAGKRREEAYAAMVQGMWEGASGSVDRALELLEKALTEFEQLGDEYGASITRVNIAEAWSLRWPIDRDEATLLVGLFEEAVEISRSQKDPGDEVAGLDGLSHALIDAGDLDRAWRTALSAVSLIETSGAGFAAMPSVIAALARSAALRGDAERALVLAGALHSATNELGRTLADSRAVALHEAESAVREALDEETAARAIARGEAMSVASLVEYVAALE